jgi:hypothetical protein
MESPEVSGGFFVRVAPWDIQKDIEKILANKEHVYGVLFYYTKRKCRQTKKLIKVAACFDIITEEYLLERAKNRGEYIGSTPEIIF